jgi:hypothetical protein
MEENKTTQNSGLTDYELMLSDLVVKIKSEESNLKGVGILAKGMTEYIKDFYSKVSDKGLISDGYHTFNEMYDHRNILFMALCSMRDYNESRHGFSDDVIVWKTRFDFENKYCGDGWFIMGIGTKKGEQITYHLPFKFWDKCKFAKSVEKVPAFDGHNSKDVIDRLMKYYI